MRGTAAIDAIFAAGGRVALLEKLRLTITRGSLYGGSAVQDSCTWVTDLATYDPTLPIITRLEFGDIPRTLGAEIASTTFELSNETMSLSDGLGGTFTATLQELSRLGLLDDARLDLWWEYSATGAFLGTSAVELHKFSGFVERALPRAGGVLLEAKSWPAKLAAINIPRHLVTPHCQHEVFDARCGASATYRSFVMAGLAGTTRAAVRITSPGGSATVEQYRAGRIECQSGRNYGCVRTIEAMVDLGGDVWEARIAPPGFPWAPAVGDTFRLFWGCDRQYSTCRDKFSNGRRFGGFPDVPLPENMA